MFERRSRPNIHTIELASGQLTYLIRFPLGVLSLGLALVLIILRLVIQVVIVTLG